MPVEITVPRLGWSMEEAVFRAWLVEEGSPVNPGQALFELESDKAAQEVESLDSGILAIPVGAPASGDTVAVGQLLGFLLAEGEAVPEYRQASPSFVPAAEPESRPAALVAIPAEPGRHDRERIAVTPRAARRAKELGIALASIVGSGRGGRIRERDILAARPVRPAGESTGVAFMTARAPAKDFDAMVTEIAGDRAGYSREDLFLRLLLSSLRAYPALNAGEPIEIGRTFGLCDFTGRRIERWVPEIPDGSVAALGIGRATGTPAEYPLNLSYDSSRVGLQEATDFLDFVCEAIESPMLGLVR